MVTNFKARLVEIPKVLKGKNSKEFIELGRFILNKKYQIFAVYTTETYTDFLTVDENSQFFWLNMSIFRG